VLTDPREPAARAAAAEAPDRAVVEDGVARDVPEHARARPLAAISLAFSPILAGVIGGLGVAGIFASLALRA
jgi:hypothetical protein